MPLTLTTVTAPEDEPLSLAEVKEHLRIDGEDQDATVGNMVTAAREYCEELLCRQLMPATLKLTLDSFPSEIIIPRPPLITLTASEAHPTLGITYVDTAGATQTLSTSAYQVDALSQPGRIVQAYGQTWPSMREQINAVTIIYRAGYADTDSVPKRIKQAILMLTAHWYESREATLIGSISKELEFSVNSLLAMDRVEMI